MPSFRIESLPASAVIVAPLNVFLILSAFAVPSMSSALFTVKSTLLTALLPIFKLIFLLSPSLIVIEPVPTFKIKSLSLATELETVPLVMCNVSSVLKPIIVSLPSPVAY